jgi:sulfatase modifying factor 1
MERLFGVAWVVMVVFALAIAAQGAVVDADGQPLTPPAHPGAILDTTTSLLWLDATETQNRSLADVQSELGIGGEFEGWQVATRSQIHQLFGDAGLPLTAPPGSGWVQDLISQARVQALASIYGQTRTTSTILGTFLWHANTFDSPGTYASEVAAWQTADDGYWAGDNGISQGWEGTAHPEFGVALVRPVSGVSANLIVNPGFDSDLSGWDNIGLTSWSSEDARGDDSSGSARLNLSVASSYAIRSSCVTAFPGEEFFYSASYLIPPGQPTAGQAMIRISSFSQVDCTGGGLGSDTTVDDMTFWTTFGNRFVAPGGTASVKIFLVSRMAGGTGDFAVHFDDVELVAVSESLIDWVPVGAPGNAADAGGSGAVSYLYEIGRYEVSNAEYVDFLNAVASTEDAFALFNPNMASDATFGGILRSGNPGSYSYAVKPGFQLKPVVYVSFWDALRFANWLDNGEPTGTQDANTTEDGAYTLTPDGIANNTVVRNPWAMVVLPDQDEWYKAAYFDPSISIYYVYPTGNDTQTSCVAPASDTGNAANCDHVLDTLTDGGAYTLSISPNGTFDQGGNALEWTEAIPSFSISSRFSFGGGWNLGPLALRTRSSTNTAPENESIARGFRVAKVPEPGATMQALVALAVLGFVARRRVATLPPVRRSQTVSRSSRAKRSSSAVAPSCRPANRPREAPRSDLIISLVAGKTAAEVTPWHD